MKENVMSSNGLGVVDFQLYLLKTMQPPGALLAAALEELGCTSSDMAVGYEGVSRETKLTEGGSADRLTTILDEAFVDQPSGMGRETFAYHLPLWPKFTFLLSFDSTRKFIYKGEFVRRPGCRAGEGVTSWDFLQIELTDSFDQICEIDTWGTYDSYTARDSNLGERCFLRFAWGLLQEIEVIRD
ncbi:hypothetical protein [Nocardia sp. NPDC051570]|uniref:hypothetical protein n=1 Tax=Nocardia sp. NPDC051570 TaxID=3364324 RepID=UPI0037B95F01